MQRRFRHDFQGNKLGGTAIGINNAGEVGFWVLDSKKQALWINMPSIRGRVNAISLIGDDYGNQVINNQIIDNKAVLSRNGTSGIDNNVRDNSTRRSQ